MNTEKWKENWKKEDEEQRENRDKYALIPCQMLSGRKRKGYETRKEVGEKNQRERREKWYSSVICC